MTAVALFCNRQKINLTTVEIQFINEANINHIFTRFIAIDTVALFRLVNKQSLILIQYSAMDYKNALLN